MRKFQSHADSGHRCASPRPTSDGPLLLTNAVQPLIRANQQSVTSDCRSRKADVVGSELIGVQQLEFVTVPNDAANAIFVDAEYLTIIAPG